MYHRIRSASFARAAVLGALTLLGAASVLAQPARLALVVGNGGYSAFPPLPACQASARDLAATLRGLGFQVVERQDATSGGMAGAIDELARGMATAPGASVLVYVCGYAAGLNDRPFLLPVSARIARPSDVMTQGLLVKAMLDALTRGDPSRGVLALDLAPANGLPAPVLDGLDSVPTPEGLGLIAVTAPPPGTGRTALSAALTAGLAAPEVGPGDLLAGLKAKLEESPGLQIALLRMPTLARPLAADEPPPAAPAEPVVAAAQTVPVPGPALPDEAALSDGQRRRIQVMLATLGYYSDRIDGRFGPETRAAIRRFQHEIGAEMTGTITGEQAAQLLARQ